MGVTLNYIYFNNRTFSTIITEKGNYYETSYNSEEFKSYLKNFDYAYANNCGDEFYKRFGDVFEKRMENQKYIYEITWDGDKLVLKEQR